MWAKVDLYRRDESILARDIAPTSKYLLGNRLAYKFARYRCTHDIGVRIVQSMHACKSHRGKKLRATSPIFLIVNVIDIFEIIVHSAVHAKQM